MRTLILVFSLLFVTTTSAFKAVPVVSNGQQANSINVLECRLFSNVTQNIDEFSVELFNELAGLLSIGDAAISLFMPKLAANSSVALIADVVFRHYNISPNNVQHGGFISKIKGVLAFLGLNVNSLIDEVKSVLGKKITKLVENLFVSLQAINQQIQMSFAEINATLDGAASSGNQNAHFCRAHVVPSMMFTSELHKEDHRQRCLVEYNKTMNTAVKQIQTTINDISDDFEVLLHGLTGTSHSPNLIENLADKLISVIRNFIEGHVANMKSQTNKTLAQIQDAKNKHDYCHQRVMNNIFDFHQAYNSTLHDCLHNWS